MGVTPSSNRHVARSKPIESTDPSSASVDGAVDIVDGVPKAEENVSAPSACCVPTGDRGLSGDDTTGPFPDAAPLPVESSERLSFTSWSFGPELLDEWREGVLSIFIESF